MDVDRDSVHGVSMRFPSGLNGPCSDERFSSKKSLDHTLLVKITDLIYFHSTTQYYTDIPSTTSQQCIAIQYNKFSTARPKSAFIQSVNKYML
jgi:hypothetical protein